MPKLKLKPGSSPGHPKYLQLIDAVISALQQGELREGESLPSVNQVIRENKLSRDTVVKAFNELKKRGVIEAIPNKGYFVCRDSEKIFLFLDSFSPFKEGLYNAFREELPETTDIEILFHHYNFRVFESMINNSIGRYSKYVVMCYDEPRIAGILKKLPPEKVVILDVKMHVANDYSEVIQDFDESFYNCLTEAESRLRKYDEIIFVHPPQTMHPMVSRDSFRRFCKDKDFKGSIADHIESADVKKGRVFIVVSDNDLACVVETAKKKKMHLGIDAGLISYNDTPLKKIIGNGITVISAEFALMGKMAAIVAGGREIKKEVVPTQLIIRDSL
jgi:DNA-binding transcriptional regulator YhcF (GntR family)